MDLDLLDRTLRERGEPPFRARQVWEWTARGASGYGAMTNLPRALREELASVVRFSTLEVETERESRDGTVKTLFRTADGHPVEAVLMRYRDGRRSLCLSSQSGCPLTCTFCATGAMAFGRNLTASEILDQALHFRRATEVDHAVFMGMGEPMLNLDEVLGAARRLPDLGITHRRTTISTVGWLPGLRRFVDEVDEAASVGGRAAARPNTPPTTAGGLYEGSSRDRIAAFRHELERARVPVTVRLTRGRDIEAACGQLAAAPRIGRSARSRAGAAT